MSRNWNLLQDPQVKHNTRSACLLHLPPHQTFSLLNLTFLTELYLTSSQVACDIISSTWPIVDTFLLHQLPNKIPLKNQDIVDLNWWGGASTSFGIGVVLGKFFAIWKYAPGFHVGPKKAFDISWAKAVAVELGLHLAIQSQLLWGSNIHIGAFRQFWNCHSCEQRLVRSSETNKITRYSSVYTCSKSKPTFGYIPCMSQVATTFQMPSPEGVSPRFSLGMHPSHHFTST